MDGFTTSLILMGDSPIINDILKLKRLKYLPQSGEQLALKTRSLEIQGQEDIIQYLDERFPMPQLISGDIDNRARIRMLYRLIQQDLAVCDDLAAEASPYIFGGVLSLIDLLVYRNTTNIKYIRFIEGIIHDTA